MSGLDEKTGGRAARLAEELRDNLRKRKNQARARKEDAFKADGADSTGNGREGGRDGTDRRRK